MDRCAGLPERDGYGLWAVQIRDNGEFIGFVGLSAPAWDAAFTPCTEIGWRLARSAWGHGYATEAAQPAHDRRRHRPDRLKCPHRSWLCHRKPCTVPSFVPDLAHGP